MPVLSAQADDPIGEGEIRLALERMAESEAFRGSPQLIAFLRYVVEATLRRQADRIKGYTIATEALGRTVDFDPQADPIVRVEATRLRRALDRYHAAAGAAGVRIDVPLGSYVPVFRRAEAKVVLALAPPVCAPAPPSRWRRLLQSPRLTWRRAAAGIVLMLFGAGSYAGLVTASRYALTASVESGSAGLSVTIRLIDSADSAAWSRGASDRRGAKPQP